jgi:hypothetical protein
MRHQQIFLLCVSTFASISAGLVQKILLLVLIFLSSMCSCLKLLKLPLLSLPPCLKLPLSGLFFMSRLFQGCEESAAGILGNMNPAPCPRKSIHDFNTCIFQVTNLKRSRSSVRSKATYSIKAVSCKKAGSFLSGYILQYHIVCIIIILHPFSNICRSLVHSCTKTQQIKKRIGQKPPERRIKGSPFFTLIFVLYN